MELTGVGPFESARVRVDAAGRITAWSGVTTQGQGLETTLAQIAADELGVTPEDVTVIAGDTAGVEHGTGSFASRAAVVGGSAVALAARDVRDKARLLASRALGCAEADLEQSDAAFTDRAAPRAARDPRGPGAAGGRGDGGRSAWIPASRARASSSPPT